jgi:hypothetical protein
VASFTGEAVNSDANLVHYKQLRVAYVDDSERMDASRLAKGTQVAFRTHMKQIGHTILHKPLFTLAFEEFTKRTENGDLDIDLDTLMGNVPVEVFYANGGSWFLMNDSETTPGNVKMDVERGGVKTKLCWRATEDIDAADGPVELRYLYDTRFPKRREVNCAADAVSKGTKELRQPCESVLSAEQTQQRAMSPLHSVDGGPRATTLATATDCSQQPECARAHFFLICFCFACCIPFYKLICSDHLLQICLFCRCFVRPERSKSMF